MREIFCTDFCRRTELLTTIGPVVVGWDDLQSLIRKVQRRTSGHEGGNGHFTGFSNLFVNKNTLSTLCIVIPWQWWKWCCWITWWGNHNWLYGTELMLACILFMESYIFEYFDLIFFFFSFLIILLFLVWYRLQMVNTAVRIKRIQLLKDNFNVVCVTAITKCFLKSWPQSFYPVENSKKSDWSVNASYPVSSAYLPCGA